MPLLLSFFFFFLCHALMSLKFIFWGRYYSCPLGSRKWQPLSSTSIQLLMCTGCRLFPRHYWVYKTNQTQHFFLIKLVPFWNVTALFLMNLLLGVVVPFKRFIAHKQNKVVFIAFGISPLGPPRKASGLCKIVNLFEGKKIFVHEFHRICSLRANTRLEVCTFKKKILCPCE